jgi:hypothetical protein
MRMPYVMNWSAGFQWNFSNTWLVEILYQGSRGVRLLNNWDINQIPLDISRDPAVLRTIFQSSQNYRPYPHFGGIQHYANYGDNSYPRQHLARGKALLGRVDAERFLHVLEVAQQRR